MRDTSLHRQPAQHAKQPRGREFQRSWWPRVRSDVMHYRWHVQRCAALRWSNKQWGYILNMTPRSWTVAIERIQIGEGLDLEGFSLVQASYWHYSVLRWNASYFKNQEHDTQSVWGVKCNRPSNTPDFACYLDSESSESFLFPTHLPCASFPLLGVKIRNGYLWLDKFMWGPNILLGVPDITCQPLLGPASATFSIQKGSTELNGAPGL